jgi:hypothetical protein
MLSGPRQTTGALGGHRLDVVLMLAVFAGAFLFKLSTFAVTNDDYLHLASVQQVLVGEVPLRDFIDQREFLLVYTSVAAQLLLGRSLSSEVLLDVTFLSAGHALVFFLASRCTRSRLLGLAGAAISVLLVPRLYSYPKIVLYVAGLALMWWYGERRRLSTLLGIALFTSVAFLFRHDHGAVIGAAMVVMIVLADAVDGWTRVARRLAIFAGTIVVLLLPFFVFLQVNGGVTAYVRSSMVMAQAEYQRTVGEIPQLVVDYAAGVPLPKAVPRRVKVRWVSSLEPARRMAAERQHGLVVPEDLGSDTFYYDLPDTSTAHVMAIVRDPLIADTEGIDRETGAVPQTTDDPNAAAWLFFLTLALPPVAALILLGDLLRPTAEGDSLPRRMRKRMQTSAWRDMATATVLAALMQVFLLRARSDVAVADVGAMTGVLAAWIAGRGLGRPPSGARLAWWTVRTLVVAWFVVSTTVALSRASGVVQFADALRDGPRAFLGRMASLRQQRPPYGDDGAKYVNACTTPSDRVLVEAEYTPDFYFRADRGFAAARGSFVVTLAPTPEAQAFSLARLRSQRVPIVLATERDGARFAEIHPDLHAYVVANYRPVGSVGPYRVFTDTRIAPTGTTAAGLPCFR